MVAGLVVVQLLFGGSSTVGTAMYERTKWVGEYFAVGSSEQFTVDQSGNATTTGRIQFDGGLSFSATFATSSAGTVTYTADSITNVSTVLHTVGGATTGTLPASTTLAAFVPNAGDMRRVVLVNTGSATLTLAGGTGTLLKTASSTKNVLSGGAAILDFVRKSDTDIVVFMSTAI